MAIITLTTDFGTRDGYVGAVKGVIAARAPDATILDIAHDVPRWDIAAGAYALAVAAPHFPAGTIHVAVIDPGVGGARKAVIARDDHHYYVGPDNGVLALACPNPREVREISAPAFRRAEVFATFHGRDVFAPAAAALALGALPAEAGPSLPALAPLPLPPLAPTPETTLGRPPETTLGRPPETTLGRPPETTLGRPETTLGRPPETTLGHPPETTLGRPPETTLGHAARIIHIDHFGNLITDLRPRPELAAARFEVRGHAVAGLVTTFESVARGQLCAYVGSAGTIEIAVREGSAAAATGAVRGDPVAITASA